MMKISTQLLKLMPNILRALSLWLILGLSGLSAAELKLIPEAPVTVVDRQITLSVSGAIGKVTWLIAQPGRINGTGNQVVYTAPSQSGIDLVAVFDEAGNNTSVKITVLSQEEVAQKFSIENANWSVFNTRRMSDFLYSKNGETLWIATNLGLEKRDATNPDNPPRIFTMLDGLPSNRITSLAHDLDGGLWVGTADKGLVHLDANDQIIALLNSSNSELSNNIVELKNDPLGHLWVATTNTNKYEQQGSTEGLEIWFEGINNPDYIDEDEKLYIDSLHPLNGQNGVPMSEPIFFENGPEDDKWSSLSTFYPDQQSLIWIISGNSISEAGTPTEAYPFNLTFSNAIHAQLPSNTHINAMIPDKSLGFWVGTAQNGLLHFAATGERIPISDSSFPSDRIVALHVDALNNIKVGYLLDDGWGIANLDNQGHWKKAFEYQAKQALPSNQIINLVSDNKQGVWITTSQRNKIHHLTARGLETFNLKEFGLDLLEQDIYGNLWLLLERDIFGNLWLSSQEALMRYTPAKKWEIFDLTHFGANSNEITGMISDAQGTLWISVGHQILRRFSEGYWEIIDTTALQDIDRIYSLQIDKAGELWVITEKAGLGGFLSEILSDDELLGEELAQYKISHRLADGTWEISYSPDSGEFGAIRTLHVAHHKEIWLGSFDGFSNFIHHRTTTGNWETIELPVSSGSINAIYSDDMGGLWIGTGADMDGLGGGIMYRQPDGNWLTFNTSNSGLAGNYITSLVSDGSGGLWVGTLLNGLQHLTFGRASQIIQNSDAYKGLGAAIIIAGGGSHKENQLWNATASVSNRIYKMLKNRGFDNSQIYYLSPQSYGDFDGDGFDDCIVDAPATPRCQLSTVEHPIKERPLKVEDVRQALAWAESRGKLDQPLYLFFIDHGVPNKLMLSEGELMTAEVFKPMLDQYQKNTDNELILVIDACHSGSFVEKLVAPNRAIISSAKAEEKAAFVELQGFSYFLAVGLESGMTFFEAFKVATEEQTEMLGEKTLFAILFGSGDSQKLKNFSQTPQLDDNGDGIFDEKDGYQLGKVDIGGHVLFGDITLTVETHTASSTLQAGQPMSLKAKAISGMGALKRVWAVLRPPKMNFVLDTYGTPILAFPRLNLSPTASEDIWETTWHDALYNGDYEITFYAEDKEGDIASSQTPLIISVIGGVAPPEEAQVQIVLDKDSYRPGEALKAELIEDLGWGYDLYAAVLLPGGSDFIALKTTNLPAQANRPQKWLSARTQNRPVRLLDLTLPTDLATGQYCLYGILSPEKEAVLENRPLWVMAERCFKVLP
jgi:ligand-binding sensor domain-containing protein